MKDQQPAGKHQKKEQMAKPSYPAYRARESLTDKIGIALKRRKKRITEWLRRAKNWIRHHRKAKVTEQIPAPETEITETSETEIPETAAVA
ncbi:MAG: hypothetical protein Q4F31_10855, partial [Eubacteriales bacterium]|nr:hypothetical protein [Eubacteriales bacterium]